MILEATYSVHVWRNGAIVWQKLDMKLTMHRLAGTCVQGEDKDSAVAYTEVVMD
jgi:hypothetical protein